MTITKEKGAFSTGRLTPECTRSVITQGRNRMLYAYVICTTFSKPSHIVIKYFTQVTASFIDSKRDLTKLSITKKH